MIETKRRKVCFDGETHLNNHALFGKDEVTLEQHTSDLNSWSCIP